MQIKKYFKIISINVLTLLGLILSYEFVLFSTFKFSDNSKSVDESKKDSNTWSFEFHPSVSNAHILSDFKSSPNKGSLTKPNQIFTQKIYGDNEKSFNILVLGGSTTDPLAFGYSGINGTWTDYFGDLISKQTNSKIIINNAASGGSTSSQEVYRMLTFLQKETPNLNISFNGINEVYFYELNDYKDFENIYAAKMTLQALKYGEINYEGSRYCKNYCVPIYIKNRIANYQKIIKSINNFDPISLAYKIKKSIKFLSDIDFIPDNKQINNLDIKTKKLSTEDKSRIKYAAKIWRNNTLAMKGISNSRGSDYIVFLQPTFGLDIEFKNLKNLSFQDNEKNLSILEYSNEEYLLKINELYKHLRNYCASLNFCIDLSKERELNSNLDLFSDARHHNSSGNKLIAEKIVSELKKYILK